MKAVQRFEAKDGRLFPSADACLRWEGIIDECATAIKPLGTRRAGSNGFIQHKPRVILATKTRLLQLAAIHCGPDPVFTMDPACVHPFSIAGRLIDESGIDPLQRAWNRICCIDEHGREWERPYFALNPGTGKNVCLNPGEV